MIVVAWVTHVNAHIVHADFDYDHVAVAAPVAGGVGGERGER